MLHINSNSAFWLHIARKLQQEREIVLVRDVTARLSTTFAFYEDIDDKNTVGLHHFELISNRCKRVNKPRREF